MRRLAPALAALALLAGCGDDQPAGTGTTAPAAEDNALKLTLDPDGPGGENARRAEVECPDPPRPEPDPLCGEVLLLSPDDLKPLPAEVPCTEIYGGPDTLRVEGTLEGKPVDATLTRADGCEIDRFDAWMPVVGKLFPDYEPGSSLAPG